MNFVLPPQSQFNGNTLKASKTSVDLVEQLSMPLYGEGYFTFANTVYFFGTKTNGRYDFLSIPSPYTSITVHFNDIIDISDYWKYSMDKFGSCLRPQWQLEAFRSIWKNKCIDMDK